MIAMGTSNPETGTGLQFRNALHEWDHVPSNLMFEGADTKHPKITIAITTFQRPDLLIEAVSSALSQQTSQPYEIIVIDNDPKSECLDLLLRKMPNLKETNFRYFVNENNIGMFGNINRTVMLARGEWLTVLHDDDLLDCIYLEKMFAEIGRVSGVDGIVSQQRLLDQRPVSRGHGEVIPPRMTGPYIWKLATSGPTGWRKILGRGLGRVVFISHVWGFKYHYLGQRSRRIKPRSFFFGPVLGNGSGFIFRTETAKRIGGFYAEEFPASDLYFYARFASLYHLRQHREEASTYRMAENETAKLDTALKAFLWLHKLQHKLVGRYVPRWWLSFAPLMIARMRGGYRELWHLEIPKQQLEELLNTRLPDDHKNLMFYIRLLVRGL
jgi:glycosyltransferase involved in cell wall biosynthesis